VTEKRQVERRKANQVTAKEKRGHAPDRRRCPDCGSAVRTHSRAVKGGTVTRRYCSKCHWQESSRQVDTDHVQVLLGFESRIFGTAKQPLLELNPALLKAAGWSLDDTLELKPLYTPGAERSLSFVLKKID
jgi:ribosomal protein S27AE